MKQEDCKVGMKVLFGRSHGEQTLGVIEKVNPAKCKVKQLEARGSMKSYPVGTIWTVPPSLMTPADASAIPVKQERPTLEPLVKLPTFQAPASFKVGDKVSFTGTHKRTITGTVKAVNAKSVTVETLTGNWRVSPGLLRKADASAPATTSTPKRSEGEIMRDILGVYSNLSPENLSCDGELSITQVNKRRAALNARLRNLEAELGRPVSEDEAWAKFGTYGR